MWWFADVKFVYAALKDLSGGSLQSPELVAVDNPKVCILLISFPSVFFHYL